MSLQVQYIQRSTGRLFKSTTESTSSFINPHSYFKNVLLGDFCPRQLFEVVFANELTPECCELLDGLIEYHQTKRGNSNIVFITRKMIINFIKEVVNDSGSDHSNLVHPPNLLEHLQRVCSDLHNSLRRKDEISRKQLALIMKHKLINEMYTQYVADAQIDHEMCRKEELLKKLQRLDYQKQIRFSQIEISTPDMKFKTTKRKKIESDVKLRLSDYTSYALPKNLHGSDNLKDHVCFYVFVGFQDPCLLKLLMRYRVPVNCILQISRKKDVQIDDLTYFWKKINEMSRNAEKFKILEEAAQMRYVYEGEIPSDEDQRRICFETRLKELEELLMNILDLKRKHIHYIKHLYPRNFYHMDLNYGPFPNYEKNLKGIPSEFITIPYIVHCMLLEVELSNVGMKQNICKDTISISPFHQDKSKPTDEIFEKEDEKKLCPFNLKFFKRRKPKEVHLKKESFRKFYEGDNLNLKIYLAESERAKNVALSDSKILMNQRFFRALKILKNPEDMDSYIPHIHHQGTPSSQKKLLSQEQTNYFLNLLYLSSMKLLGSNSKIYKIPENSFLCTPYDLFQNKNFLPASITILEGSQNWYSKFDSMLFRWKEPLSASTIAQWLFEAQQEFSEVDFKYCESTNTLVVHFHQNLKPPGTRTKIWIESLRTITCFRDFCSFYYFEEAGWFSKFQPIQHINYETYTKTEDKFVFERLIESNDNYYKEYEKFLIPYYFCDNFHMNEGASCPKIDNVKKFSHLPPIMKPNLEDIISELQSYPCSKELLQNCGKYFSTSSLRAYDQNPSRFGLTGTTHDFFSHDGVQVTIDTSRFLFEDFKLSVRLKFDGHSLIGHLKNRHLDPHMVLKDGTVLKFILPVPKLFKDIDSCICSEDIEIIKSILAFNLKKFKEDTEILTESNLMFTEMPKFRPEVRHVIPIHNEDLEKINLDHSLVWNKIKKNPYERNVNRDIKILNQLNNTNLFHKYVNSRKLNYVSKRSRFLQIPYSSFVRRILARPMKQKCYSIYRRRRFHSKYYTKFQHTYQKDSPHIKLSLPNGLTLESFTSKGNGDVIVVKQAHLERHKYQSIMSEDYRLFLGHGKILIRFSNGNIRILDSQGTILDFKQKQKDECDVEKCFKTIENCRKMIYRLSLSKNKICHDIQDYSRSRRGHLIPSIGLKLRSNSLEVLEPFHALYSSIQMYTLEGFVLKLKEQSISKKHFARVLKNWDFQTRQMLLERTDGMKSLSRNNGDQIVVFPDGTKITKAVHVGKELEFFLKKDKEGWVVIYHTYLYEHPFYCPIMFDGRTNQTCVVLKQNTEIKLSKISTSISFAGNCELLVNAENIYFTKYCPKCGSKCICEIKVNLKDSDKESGRLLVCTDSYKKKFTSDFVGRCQINTNFLGGELNSQNCNHVLKRDYHKAFLINDDMTGDLLWNDNMIMRELKRMEDLIDKVPAKANVEQFTDPCNNLPSISFTRNYYQSLNEKFLWFEYLQPLPYSGRKENLDSEKNVKFQIYRKIFNVLREKETNILYYVIKKLLEDDKSKIKPSFRSQESLNL